MNRGNSEQDPNYYANATGSQPIAVPASDGWYLLPSDYGAEGQIVVGTAVWHLGRRWEAPDHALVPYELRGAQTVFEFCQGAAALSGKGAGALDWNGPHEVPTEDWPGNKICELCTKIADLLNKDNIEEVLAGE